MLLFRLTKNLMENELDIIEQRVRKEVELKNYKGFDRVVLAKDKMVEVAEDKLTRQPFTAKMGLPILDDCTDGFRRGQLVIVSGPPKNGKTLLCQNFTKKFTEQEHRCLWFEYELGAEEFLEKFPPDSLDFYLPNQMHGKDLDWIENRIIEAKQKFGTDIIFIDHLDFLRDTNTLKNVSLNLATYVGGIVQKVKSIAVQHEVLIFMMSHIRKNNWTSGKLPSSEDLRDTGQIAQLADIVMMVMRERNKAGSSEVYHETNAIVGVIENRHNGKTKIVKSQVTNGIFQETSLRIDTASDLYEPQDANF